MNRRSLLRGAVVLPATAAVAAIGLIPPGAQVVATPSSLDMAARVKLACDQYGQGVMTLTQVREALGIDWWGAYDRNDELVAISRDPGTLADVPP